MSPSLAPLPTSRASSMDTAVGAPSSFNSSPPLKAKASTPTRESGRDELALDADLGRALERSSSDAPIDVEKALPGEKAPSGALTLAEDDVDNPRNWTLRKKWAVDLALCLWTLSLTYSSTAFVASVPALERKFHVSQEVIILGVTLNVAGFAAGPLVAGPSSELFGRRPVYIFTAIFYTAFVAGVAWAPNAAAMLIFRFLAGFFGAAAINNPPASVSDITTLNERGLFQIPYALLAFGGPTLGPLCSEFIETAAGYKWNFYVSLIYTAVTSIAVAFVPETHGPTILARRNRKLGLGAAKPTTGQIVATYRIALKRPFEFLLFEPVVGLVCLYLSVLYGMLYGFFEAFIVVYEEIRGFDSNSYGLTYISLGVGFLLGAALLATVGKRSYIKQAVAAKARGESTPPEARLTLALFGAFAVPIALFLFAWTAPYPSVHWIVPCIGESLFAMGTLCIFTSYIPYLADISGPMAASALAAGMTSRALLAAAFPLFSIQMYHKLGVAGAVSLLAGLTVLLAPMPFVFRRYGATLRARSTRLVR